MFQCGRNDLDVKVDCVIVAVAHEGFKEINLEKFMKDAPVFNWCARDV